MHTLQTAVDLQQLIDDIGQRPVVMLGEASHGTHEYYTWRTAISKRLVEEKQFNFIAVEGDWPDCYKINRFIKGYADAGDDIKNVLKNFDRWPTWMWANWEVAAFAEWLRSYNKQLPPAQKIGFYGLDVYSLWDSMQEMIAYLDKEDKRAAAYVRKAVACFEPFNQDEHQYARHAMRSSNCADAVVSLLKEVRLRAQFLGGDREAGFNTEQNALIAVNAEKYYRAMMDFDNESWNIRDRHMMETFERLMSFHSPRAKGIVWEHNTHIGDARATDMAHQGMINIGELAREKYGEGNVYLVGFGSYAGTVIAADEWGEPIDVMDVPGAREDSLEAFLHNTYGQNGYFIIKEETSPVFSKRTGHRAIGVV